ncbi:hypothetical protein [Ramlibacter montanisoli]|uniref:Uncharacterized protein n=1 Tax=Ramlibacter montanisoli TaxID=2732512 RepID=A0A849KIJ4_9BURK|nr:hypothetical protein [Ramlibacter montanisoli]NNU45246.1 hypothetical protein [Ramlibacter montanisoli]
MPAESSRFMRRWWIDEATVLAGSNPNDGDLSALRAEGFGMAVSLLDASQQRPNFDPGSAAGRGWMLYTIPIDQRAAAPTLVQACEFAALLGAVSNVTKSLVFCSDDVGRPAFMGAVYWIAKGIPVSAAMARVTLSARVDITWHESSEEVLRSFGKLGWRIRS